MKLYLKITKGLKIEFDKELTLAKQTFIQVDL